MARLIAERETLTPRSSSHISQWRSKVASSFSSSCSRKARSSSAVARMRRFRPVEVPGERSSPSLLFLSQRLSVVRETEKVSTTSLLGMPRSTASTALTLRSFE
jgi:hypothetical protein